MALGARNKASSKNRPKPELTKLDKLKAILRDQYAVHKASQPTPSPEPKK